MATDELEQAQKAFQKQVDAVQAHTEWDERTKEIQLANIQRVAQRRLDVAKQGIEDRKLNEIREAKADSEQRIRGIRNWVRVGGRGRAAAAAAYPGTLCVDLAPDARESGSQSEAARL